jgi:hypothetical protein
MQKFELPKYLNEELAAIVGCPQRLPSSWVATITGISREEIIEAVKSGRLGGILEDGDCYVYTDEMRRPAYDIGGLSRLMLYRSALVERPRFPLATIRAMVREKGVITIEDVAAMTGQTVDEVKLDVESDRLLCLVRPKLVEEGLSSRPWLIYWTALVDEVGQDEMRREDEAVRNGPSAN